MYLLDISADLSLSLLVHSPTPLMVQSEDRPHHLILSHTRVRSLFCLAHLRLHLKQRRFNQLKPVWRRFRIRTADLWHQKKKGNKITRGSKFVSVTENLKSSERNVTAHGTLLLLNGLAFPKAMPHVKE